MASPFQWHESAIDKWLSQNGLPLYTLQFEEEQMDGTCLLLLTKEGLADLGFRVTSVTKLLREAMAQEWPGPPSAAETPHAEDASVQVGSATLTPKHQQRVHYPETPQAVLDRVTGGP